MKWIYITYRVLCGTPERAGNIVEQRSTLRPPHLTPPQRWFWSREHGNAASYQHKKQMQFFLEFRKSGFYHEINTGYTSVCKLFRNLLCLFRSIGHILQASGVSSRYHGGRNLVTVFDDEQRKKLENKSIANLTGTRVANVRRVEESHYRRFNDNIGRHRSISLRRSRCCWNTADDEFMVWKRAKSSALGGEYPSPALQIPV